MPRNVKNRRICSEPDKLYFTALNSEKKVIISVEEAEAIRLCDAEDLSQEEAAALMNVSRGTFQRILYSAHKKIAVSINEGYDMEITGGNYEVIKHACNGKKKCKKCRFNNKKLSIQEHEEE